jgi:D-sedoheptulose 7-phosphate isomerase
MNSKNRIPYLFSENINLHQAVMIESADLIETAADRLVSALLNDRKILTCGNGGAALCASIFASSLINQFERIRPALPAISLVADAVMQTALTHDNSEEIYAKQLRALSQTGDLLVIYSENGNSPLLAKAIITAQSKNVGVIALTGQQDSLIGALLKEKDIEIRIPSDSPARIREIHLLLTHCFCDLIDQQLFGS